MKDFIEYTDNYDKYKKPKRHRENEILNIRLYCFANNDLTEKNYKKCNKYIKGKEGYNGGFIAETGQYADLRNECWYCKEHQLEVIKLQNELELTKFKSNIS